MKEKIKGMKKIWEVIKDYYKSLSPTGKLIFIIVLVLIKLGPDMILFPMLYKYIEKKRSKKLERAHNEFENEIETVLAEVDFK